MGRRREKAGFEALVALPWQAGFVLGIAGFIAVRYGIAWWLSRHGGPLLQGVAQQSETLLAPLAWLVLAICWLAAFFSYLGKRHRRQLLETRTTLESLSADGWRQFELLVGEAFRRQGYTIEETGLGSADFPGRQPDTAITQQTYRTAIASTCPSLRKRDDGAEESAHR